MTPKTAQSNQSEEKGFFRSIRDNWAIIITVAGFISFLGVLSFRVAGVELKVDAKVDKEVLELKLEPMRNDLDDIQEDIKEINANIKELVLSHQK